MGGSIEFLNLKFFLDNTRKQLGISGGVPVGEYQMAIGLKGNEAVEVHFLRKAFFEIYNFENKLIFFPLRVSYSKREDGVGVTAENLNKYLLGFWEPLKNLKKFDGKDLLERKLNFLKDFLSTLIKRTDKNFIEIYLESKEKIALKEKDYFLRGIAFSLKDSLLFDKAVVRKIYLYKPGCSLVEFFYDKFLLSAEIKIKDKKNFVENVKKSIVNSLFRRSFSLTFPKEYVKIILSFV